MFRRALKGHEKESGHNTLFTFETVHNLGDLYRDQGNLDEAEDMFRRALKGYPEAGGLEHPNRKLIVNNLQSLQKKGKRGGKLNVILWLFNKR